MDLTYLIFIILIESSLSLRLPKDGVIKYEDECMNLLKKPYFKTDMVIGKPWHIYYTWNIMEKGCYSMVLRKATQYLIDRIRRNMYAEVQRQPNWESAALHITFKSGAGNIKKANFLLIPKPDALGYFEGVPDIPRVFHATGTGIGTSIHNFAMKLAERGKYFIILDCDLNVASMAVRKDQFSPDEIEEVASRYNLGDGAMACLRDIKNVTK